MNILIIGASGIIGSAIVTELSARHDIITAGRNSGDLRVDITDTQSIQSMFEQTSNLDAVVLATGQVHFGELKDMQEKEYHIGLQSKLMGQVNTVAIGQQYLNDQGSFTLTSGILNRDPIRFGASAAMVNGALDGYTKAAALELPRGLRINCVSPTVIEEAMENYAPYFRGYQPVSAAQAALAYSKSVEGLQTGQVFVVE